VALTSGADRNMVGDGRADSCPGRRSGASVDSDGADQIQLILEGGSA
jgi:hypothetical protein